MLRFLDNNKLWWFAGEDPYVLSQCSKRIRRTFSLIGILVIFVSLTSAVSMAYGVHQILESTSADIVIGCYCGLFIFILYIFLLHTLSRNVLPGNKHDWFGKLVSYVIRVGFLVFLGLLVTQPISSFVFQNQVENELITFKNHEIKEVNNRLNIYYAEKLKEARKKLTSKNQIIQEIRNNERLKNRELREFFKSQEERNYFIRKMLILNTLFYFDKKSHADVNTSLVLYSWALDLLFIFIFVAPVFLKALISISTGYYKTKRIIETGIIDGHHRRFVVSYNEILRKNYPDSQLQYSTIYKDSPYNTELKSQPGFKDKNDFIKWLLDENN